MMNVNFSRESYKNIMIFVHGPGLVGPIVGEYFAEYGNFKYIGGFFPRKGVPVSIIINGIPYPSIRVYESEKNLMIIVDQDLSREDMEELYENIKKIYKKFKIERIIVVNGIQANDREIYYISRKEDFRYIKRLLEGVVTGIPALLLLDNEINTVFLLGGVIDIELDPQSALKVIEFLSELTDEKIDVSIIEKEIEEYLEAIKQSMELRKKEIPLKKMLFR